MIKLNPRERKIAIIVAVCLGTWAFYELALTPLMAQQADLQSQIDDANSGLRQNKQLKLRAQMDDKRWHLMEKYGLHTDPATSESQMLHAIENWARDAQLSMTGNKPDRAEAQKPFERITFHVSSTGNLMAINRFLWDVETATIPTRIEDLNITARKEGTNDLSLSVAISTLCVVPSSTQPTGGLTR
ncbi:MAG TPA: GspMb/PilO family protein [Tepidisphaeraceae bacterium]|jgi:Tfp pilus assembly protein PilO